MIDINKSKNINLARIDTHGGNVQLGDNYYMSLEYQTIKEKIDDLKDLIALSNKPSKIQDYRKRLAEEEKKLELLKKSVIQLAETFQKIALNTERLKKAKAHFDKGEFKEARAVLDIAEMNGELNALLTQKENLAAKTKENEQSLADKAEEFLIAALATTTDFSLNSTERYTQANHAFEQSLKAQYSIKTMILYIHFLQDFYKLKKAESLCKETLEKLKTENNNNIEFDKAHIYNVLANIHKKSLNLEQALNYQKQSLTILKKIFEPNHPNIANCYNNLAIIYQDLGDLEQALTYQKQALVIREKIFKPNHSDLANSYNNIATTYEKLENYSKAFFYQNKALTIYKKLFDSNLSDLAVSYNNIAHISKKLGNLKQAFFYQKQALEIDKKIFEANHPDLAISYYNLSNICQALGILKKALKFQKQALAIREKIFESNHPDLASSYNNIAIIYKDLGDLDQALTYQKQALNIFEKILDEQHPNLATAYNNIASIYQDLGNAKNALVYQKQALDILEKIFEPNHPDIATYYHNLSGIYIDLKNRKAALFYNKKALDIFQYCYPNHPFFKKALEVKQFLKRNKKL